jgi:hypothetical protein
MHLVLFLSIVSSFFFGRGSLGNEFPIVILAGLKLEFGAKGENPIKG